MRALVILLGIGCTLLLGGIATLAFPREKNLKSAPRVTLEAPQGFFRFYCTAYDLQGEWKRVYSQGEMTFNGEKYTSLELGTKRKEMKFYLHLSNSQTKVKFEVPYTTTSASPVRDLLARMSIFYNNIFDHTQPDEWLRVNENHYVSYTRPLIIGFDVEGALTNPLAEEERCKAKIVDKESQ